MNNKLSPRAYIIFSVLLTFTAMMLYFRFIYISVYELTHYSSRFLFTVLLLVPAVICIRTDYSRRRKIDTLVFVILSSLGLYTVISNFFWNTSFTVTMCIITVALIVFVHYSKRKNKQTSEDYITKCTLRVTALMSSVFMIFSYYQVSSGFFRFAIDEDWFYFDKDPYKMYSDTVSQFQDETWITLSDKEKCAALNSVIQIEYKILGISKEPVVYFSSIPEGKYAFFSSCDDSINISMNEIALRPQETLLTAALHEVYHAYQNELVSMYNETDPQYQNLIMFKNVPSYIKETANYNNGDDDMLKYYTQKCEEDARNYAKRTVKHYLKSNTSYIEDDFTYEDFMNFMIGFN